MIDEVSAALRVGRIGGSDMAAVCGLDPWRSPYDVWAEKTGRVNGFSGNRATDMGERLEPVCLDYLEEQLGVPIVRDQCLLANDEIRIANYDGLVVIDGRPRNCEAKTTAIASRSRAEDWGDEQGGSGGIPKRVLIQIHHGLGVLDDHQPGAEFSEVIALIGGRGFVRYTIPRSNDLVQVLIERACDFHKDFIAKDIPPEQSGPSPDVAKVLKRVEGKSVEIPANIVAKWRQAKADAKVARDREDEAEALIKAALGDAEIGHSDSGTVTFYEINRKGYVVEPTTYRRLSFKQH